MNLRSLILAALLPATALAQALEPPAQMPPTSGLILTTQTTLVLVPALVRTKSGQLVYTLTANDFSLTDNGVQQKLSLIDDTDSQPLALVIVVENGAVGAHELDKLANLGNFLDNLVGGVRHRVAIVSFDSTPHIEQPFTSNMRTISAAMQNITPGNDGAAILDALNYSVGMLRQQPDNFRRAILLFSETIDHHSHSDLSQTLRAITDTNTIIYSLGFSTPRNELGHGSGKALGDSEPGPPRGCMARDNLPADDSGLDTSAADAAAANSTTEPDKNNFDKARMKQAWNCLGLLVPPLKLAQVAAVAAIDSMRRNTPETVARLTGGEYYKVESLNSVTRDLMTISNHVPNRYMLSFHPQSPAPGPHVLHLSLPDHVNLSVSARSAYWADDPAAAASLAAPTPQN